MALETELMKFKVLKKCVGTKGFLLFQQPRYSLILQSQDPKLNAVVVDREVPLDTFCKYEEGQDAEIYMYSKRRFFTREEKHWYFTKEEASVWFAP